MRRDAQPALCAAHPDIGVAPGNVDSIIAKAAGAGIGLYSIAPHYARPLRRAGLLFGYASLGENDIRAGVRKPAAVI